MLPAKLCEAFHPDVVSHYYLLTIKAFEIHLTLKIREHPVMLEFFAEMEYRSAKSRKRINSDESAISLTKVKYRKYTTSRTEG